MLQLVVRIQRSLTELMLVHTTRQQRVTCQTSLIAATTSRGLGVNFLPAKGFKRGAAPLCRNDFFLSVL